MDLLIIAKVVGEARKSGNKVESIVMRIPMKSSA